jgi:hypothetical protein
MEHGVVICGSVMTAAIYAMYYTGMAGMGLGVFVLRDGIVSGADATGGLIDGTCATDQAGNLQLQIRLTVAAGTTLVTGGSPSPSPYSLEFPVALRAGFGNMEPVEISIPTGPVNVVFRKLRDLAA